MDTETPILFLRPFDIDQLIISNSSFLSRRKFSFKDYERLLKKAVGHLGPFVAVGKPGDKVPPLGAARMYVDDENWQETVVKLTRKAKLVFIFIDDSKGLLWELENTIKHLQPEQLILCLPMVKRGDYPDQDKYSDFLDRHQSILPTELPRNIGNTQFIYFGKNWTPHLFEPGTKQTFNNLQNSSSTKDLVLALKGLNNVFALRSTPLYLRHPSTWVLFILFLFLLSLAI